MSENKFSTLGIILLIVGLIVGAGGGYFYISSNKTPILDDLVAEKASLISSIEELDSSIVNLEESKSDLESDVDLLDDEIQDLQIEVNAMNNEISSLEHNVEVYNEKIDELESRVEKLTDYEIFSIHDLWFQYPAVMSFEFDEMLENDFSDKYGIVQGELERVSRDEFISFVWQHVDFDPDVEADVTNLAQDYSDRMKNDYDLDSTISKVLTCDVDGHTFYYLTVTVMADGDEQIRVTYGTWYCSLNSLAYRFTYYNTNPSSEDRYMNTINTIFCH